MENNESRYTGSGKGAKINHHNIQYLTTHKNIISEKYWDYF